MTQTADDARLLAAELFLAEAVYRSRGDQAGATLLSGGAAGCGLGEKPSVVLDLSPRGEELFGELFPSAPTEAQLVSIRGVMAAWVKRQDGLDRQRNHFLKDFRNAHGMDRRAYDDHVLAQYEDGLNKVNETVAGERREAARALLDAVAG